MPASLELIKHSLDAVEVCLSDNQSKSDTRELKFHIEALREDVLLVCLSGPRTQSGELEQKALKLVADAQETIRKLNNVLLDLESSLQQPPATNAATQAKLEQWQMVAMKMPTFEGGDACTFLRYRNFIQKNVVGNEKLDVRTKWLYFLNSCSGKPAEIIFEYPSTLEGMKSAIRHLEVIYGGKDEAAAELMEKFKNLKQADMSWTSLSLKHLELEGLLGWLADLDYQVELTKIRYKYLEKFPPSLISEVNTDLSVTLEAIRKEVGIKISKLEEPKSRKRKHGSPGDSEEAGRSMPKGNSRNVFP